MFEPYLFLVKRECFGLTYTQYPTLEDKLLKIFHHGRDYTKFLTFRCNLTRRSSRMLLQVIHHMSKLKIRELFSNIVKYHKGTDSPSTVDVTLNRADTTIRPTVHRVVENTPACLDQSVTSDVRENEQNPPELRPSKVALPASSGMKLYNQDSSLSLNRLVAALKDRSLFSAAHYVIAVSYMSDECRRRLDASHDRFQRFLIASSLLNIATDKLKEAMTAIYDQFNLGSFGDVLGFIIKDLCHRNNIQFQMPILPA